MNAGAQHNRKYRAVSWWIKWNDLAWPDDDIADNIKRRADMAAATGVDCAVVFGAHFRWDFMPLWLTLHGLLRFIAEELHKRQIELFDHHSSVLTHSYANLEEAQAMRIYNRHHVPFAPSRDIAATWTCNGTKMDDWTMIDVTTGEPVILPQYTARQFCMNNPDFQNAYYGYVKKLLKETNIDGLMSDDGIFYSKWTSCGCVWCRKKFKERYGHTLPPVTDLSFWGNYGNEAFKDWIEMRFATTREFMQGVRNVTGDGFPLMSCCSGSASQSIVACGLTYQEFIKPCNIVMMEKCGNIPPWQGAFHELMLHVGIARENEAPCIGLGYGFTGATADFTWALNKFIGSGTWFSTLKGRLGLPDSKMTVLKDDTELCGHGYLFEKNNPALFDAESDAGVAVFFSRWTRDFYAMTPEDYTADYRETCFELLRDNITFDVVTVIPAVSEYKILVLSSVACLDDREYSALNEYLAAGGVVIATGPVGINNKRGNPAVKPWLEQFGVNCAIQEPERIPAFPPCSKQADTVPACEGSFKGTALNNCEWTELETGDGRFYWAPGRMQNAADKLMITRIARKYVSENFSLPTNSGWHFRIFKRKDGARIIHALAEDADTTCMDDLEQIRAGNKYMKLIDSVRRKECIKSKFDLRLHDHRATVKYYAPTAGLHKLIPVKNGTADITVEDEVCYFILLVES